MKLWPKIHTSTYIDVNIQQNTNSYILTCNDKKWREKNVINLLWKCEQANECEEEKKNVSMLINQQHLQHNHDLNSVFSFCYSLCHALSLVLIVTYKKEWEKKQRWWHSPYKHMHETCNKMHYNENCFLSCLFHLASYLFQSKWIINLQAHFVRLARAHRNPKEEKTANAMHGTHTHSHSSTRCRKKRARATERDPKRKGVESVCRKSTWDNRISA